MVGSTNNKHGVLVCALSCPSHANADVLADGDPWLKDVMRPIDNWLGAGRDSVHRAAPFGLLEMEGTARGFFSGYSYID